MQTASAEGQVRGLVRSFDGKGLPAKVSIEPGGIEAEAGADGSFNVDVAPGTYTVTVQSEGYGKQTHRVKVGRDGVVVLNVDMRRVGR
jgi:uncharacterized membrane protein